MACGSGADRQALDLAVAPSALGRPYIAPPGIPAERVKALQSAFLATTKDQAFRAEIENSGLELSLVLSGEEAKALLRRFYATPRDVVARVAAMTKGG